MFTFNGILRFQEKNSTTAFENKFTVIFYYDRQADDVNSLNANW